LDKTGSSTQDESGHGVPKAQAPKQKSLEPYGGVPSSLYDNGPIGLCYLDLDLRYLDINKWLAAVNGLAVKEHLGRTIGEVVPDVARGVEEKLRQVITTGEPIEGETVAERTPSQPGIRRTFRYNFYPVKSAEGTVAGVSCAVQDVTKPRAREAGMPEAGQPVADQPHAPDRKRIEEPMDRSMALEVANRELEAFHEALTHGLKRSLLIVTNLSHQLRETLGDSIGEQEAADLERIRAAGQQMMHVIDDLRGIGNVNRVEVSREEVDLSAMGRDIIGDLGAMTPDRVVAFEVEAGIKAFGDPSLVKILLTNLLRNAWKFTGPRKDAWIELGVVEDEDDVPIYHVRDNGIGFDNADSEIIFQVFKRLPTSEEFPGSGLGLATVERIVRRHSGRVWADGVPGEGAVVRFTLRSSWAAS
jgi:PAS domain S-box-containing protein